jgi:16S rRNA (guanine(1405)-N(7))-methyltransferase
MSGGEPSDEAIRAVADRVAASRRYRVVDLSVVRRLVSEELARARTDEEAVKRVKRRLHQAVGAYRGPGDAHLERDLERLDAAQAQDPSGAELRTVCRDLLSRHASTRERLPYLDRFYAGIWEAMGGSPANLLDLGCGIAPLSLPWMDLPATGRYHATDADGAAIRLVDGFLSLVGQPHLAEARDLATEFALPRVDVALLLKLVPILDRQDSAAVTRLLRRLEARNLVLSFPVRSLGGHGKGMEATYRRRVDAILRDLEPRVEQVAEASVANELVMVLMLGDEKAGSG